MPDTTAARGDAPVALDELTVIGEQEQSYKADTSASKKYTAPLRETPKSVTVITDQVIRDTGSLTLVDALRTTSGITFGAGEGGNPAGDRPIIRGFNAESDTFIDGLRDVGSQTREIFNVERIEVSKAGVGLHWRGLHGWQPQSDQQDRQAARLRRRQRHPRLGPDAPLHAGRQPRARRQRRRAPEPHEARSQRRRARWR